MNLRQVKTKLYGLREFVMTNNNCKYFSNYSLIHTWVNFQVSLSIEQTRGNVSGVIYKPWAQLSKLQQRLVVIWNRSERENSKHNMIDKLQHSTFLSMTNNTTHKQHQVQRSFFHSITRHPPQKLMFCIDMYLYISVTFYTLEHSWNVNN